MFRLRNGCTISAQTHTRAREKKYRRPRRAETLQESEERPLPLWLPYGFDGQTLGNSREIRRSAFIEEPQICSAAIKRYPQKKIDCIMNGVLSLWVEAENRMCTRRLKNKTNYNEQRYDVYISKTSTIECRFNSRKLW